MSVGAPKRGDRVVRFEFDAVRVGVATNERGPTGCTVVTFDRPAAIELDVRGGAPVRAITAEELGYAAVTFLDALGER